MYEVLFEVKPDVRKDIQAVVKFGHCRVRRIWYVLVRFGGAALRLRPVAGQGPRTGPHRSSLADSFLYRAVRL